MSRRRTSEARARLAVDTLEEFRDLPAEPLTVRVSTAVKLTGIPRTTLYELIRDGQIETVKIGRSTLIPYRCLRRLIDG